MIKNILKSNQTNERSKGLKQISRGQPKNKGHSK